MPDSLYLHDSNNFFLLKLEPLTVCLTEHWKQYTSIQKMVEGWSCLRESSVPYSQNPSTAIFSLTHACSFLLSRLFSMKRVTSKAVTGSATLTAWTPLGTSTVATPSVSVVGTGWPMRSLSTWVTSTFLALENTPTTTAGWASTTVCAPARCSPL